MHAQAQYVFRLPLQQALGNPRLAGSTVQIDIHEATMLTLFGTVVTDEHV